MYRHSDSAALDRPADVAIQSSRRTLRLSRQLSVPQQILEGLREMAEFATSDEPPEKRYTVRHVTLDLEPGNHAPDKVRATREIFGLSQPLFARFLGVEVSALRHWEQGIRSPSAVVRRFLDELLELLGPPPRLFRGVFPNCATRAWSPFGSRERRGLRLENRFNKKSTKC
jgi:DNA-binding transcriptional regulator YiaG